jgi:hypothetical protein
MLLVNARLSFILSVGQFVYNRAVLTVRWQRSIVSIGDLQLEIEIEEDKIQ